MVQPVSAATPIAAPTPLKPASSPPGAVTAAPSTQASTDAPRREASAAPSEPPLSVGVERADNGVFVYTLKDTDSGRVVVVVPHVELRTDGVRT